MAGVPVFVCGAVFAMGCLAQPLRSPGPTTAPKVQPGQILQFDSVQPGDQELRFDRGTRDLIPEAGPFRLVEYHAMSNYLGERWALVTVVNTQNANRFLKQTHLVATFADGSQRRAQNLNDPVGPFERFSKAVFFGHSPFPLVHVEARMR
jgi:hypothetical protein